MAGAITRSAMSPGPTMPQRITSANHLAEDAQEIATQDRFDRFWSMPARGQALADRTEAADVRQGRRVVAQLVLEVGADGYVGGARDGNQVVDRVEQHRQAG